MFLHYTIPILIRQNIKFKIFVVSQIDGNLFNRAKLLNIGFNEGKLEVYALNKWPFWSMVKSRVVSIMYSQPNFRAKFYQENHVIG